MNRPNRQMRHRRGKSDTVDAEAAARAALSGDAATAAIPRRQSSRRPTLPDKPTTHWLETNKPSLHKTQCDSSTIERGTAPNHRLVPAYRDWLNTLTPAA